MSEGIVYQNKDIEFKILSEAYRERSFGAYGLNLPRIKEVLPTDLPAVSANEMRMDNLFLLEDGTYALVDYESADAVKNRVKYMGYISRVMKRLYSENGKIPEMRMVVIYTGDVERADDVFRAGCITLHIEQAFVSRLPAEDIYQAVRHRLGCGEKLTEQELMQLIILPLAEKGEEGKQERIRQVVGLVKQIEDEREQRFVLSGLLVATDKFISREMAEAIRREITMTKVGRLIFEDGMAEGESRGKKEGKKEGREEGKKEGREEGKKEGREEGKKEERIIAVINMLGFNIPEQQILEKYSRKDLEAAKEAVKGRMS